MKKKIFGILSALLCAVMALASCGTQTPGTNSADDGIITPPAAGQTEGNMHSYIVRETDKFIVKDGKSDYRILIPEGKASDAYISAAVSDLRLFFLEATGIELPVAEDDGDLSGGKFLAIGDTRLQSNEALGATEEALGRGGVRIRTVGDSVCMTGATEEAAMYAVYTFLEQALGFEYYYTDFYDLDKNVAELRLMDYDITDVPDFEYRIQSTGWVRYNDVNRKRMRWTNETDLFIPVDGATWHNTFKYLPPATYQAEHPDWYSVRGDQLCYTARGNAEERDAMIENIAGQITGLFSREEYRNYNLISVSIEDNQNCCTCEACAAEKAKYGADSAVIVKFCNDIAKRVTAWMETEKGKPYARDYRILFFAYHATNKPPVTYDAATDTFSRADDSVVCDEHVAVYFAETNGDYTQNYEDANTANTEIGQNMRGWGTLTNEIYFWSYSTNFTNFLMPYNSFDAVQDIYKFALREGCHYIMTQDQWVQTGTQSGFGVFKNWLQAKLGWNVNADVAALTDQFFEGYFKEAAEPMRRLFDEWRVWAKYQTDELGYSGYRSIYINALTETYWPQRMLTHWLDLLDEARAAIAGYEETDPAMYRALSDHIDTESISFRYLLIELYGVQYSAADLQQMRRDFVADTQRLGLTRMNANTTIAQGLFSTWGM